MAQHRQGEIGQLVGLQPEPEGDGQFIALGGEEAPHHHGEAEPAVVMGRQEGQVVVEQEAVGSTADGHVELAGQVARAIGAEQAILDGLHQRAVRSGAWVFALRIAEQGFNFVRMIIIARILAPDDFGLFGIAMLAMATLSTFTATGFGTALIQKKERVEDYLDTAWTVIILRGVIIFVCPLLYCPLCRYLF